MVVSRACVGPRPPWIVRLQDQVEVVGDVGLADRLEPFESLVLEEIAEVDHEVRVPVDASYGVRIGVRWLVDLIVVEGQRSCRVTSNACTVEIRRTDIVPVAVETFVLVSRPCLARILQRCSSMSSQGCACKHSDE